MARRKRKQIARKVKEQKIQEKPQESSFRWGESYTSLLLGIIVVIIGVLFFISLAKSQHTKEVTSIATNIATETSVPLHITPTTQPTTLVTKLLSETITPKQIIATPKITEIPNPKPTPQNIKAQTYYTVQTGDDLWHIAEKFYNSGYNWIDIAKANNMQNPGILFKGTVIVIPQVTPSLITITLTPTQMPVTTPSVSISNPANNSMPNAITSNTYEVQKGDNLWDIAVRAYSDGYKWTDIAKANNLTEPSLIHSGNVLKIPR